MRPTGKEGDAVRDDAVEIAEDPESAASILGAGSLAGE
jgi:hypothetical protein